jgi:hypothetical protein
MANVNIAGLDKAEVLLALWQASRTQGRSWLGWVSGELTLEQAKQEIEDRKHTAFDSKNSIYFDYLNGRVMKVDLGQDEFDSRLYDRDNGDGAAQQAIDNLRLAHKVAAQVADGCGVSKAVLEEVTKDENRISDSAIREFLGGDQT